MQIELNLNKEVSLIIEFSSNFLDNEENYQSYLYAIFGKLKKNQYKRIFEIISKKKTIFFHKPWGFLSTQSRCDNK